ncbi:MAG: hypothetical protein K8T25_10725 [Planctomycetia bacterium]|nr:hypothetical protein [Planctomycetia bacterium]
MTYRAKSMRPLSWMLLAVMVSPLCGAGCTLLATGLYIFNPNDSPAEYPGLKQQRVAVVCRAATSLELEAASTTDELARQVAAILKKEVTKIHLVPQKEVNDWMDNNEMKSYVELGKALKVDRVVAIDLDRLSLYDGRTLFQGKCQAHLTVYDVETGEATELKLLSTAYPPRNGVPTDIPEQQFRQKFVSIVAGQIARRFHSFDSRMLGDDQFYREE